MTRPLTQRVAEEAATGVAIDPLSILAALEILIPLLKLCAGPDPAAWLAGDGALVSRKWAARRRERLVRERLAEHSVPPLVADRLVERLRAVRPLEVAVLYHEAEL
jgi:hypothetical protein